MCEDYKCKNCGNNVIYDKKHKRYPKFCSKECRKNYTINHNPHYCVICGELAKYNRKLGCWNKTCGLEECVKKALSIGQEKGVENRVKLNISKEELYEIFINQNKTRKEVAKYFNCSEANIKKMCRIYNIVKNQKNALKNTFKTKLEKYGDPYYTNNDIISKKETEWLDSISIPNDDKHRQVVLNGYRVDGFKDNIIYEFLGDYWHGNPCLFELNEFNKHNGKTMKELYEETFKRFDMLLSLGYKIIYIWESDYNKGKEPIEYKKSL